MQIDKFETKLTINQKLYLYEVHKKNKTYNQKMINYLMREVIRLIKDNQSHKKAMKVFAKDVPQYLIDWDPSNDF